jgi:hypothetical protein
MKLSAVLLGWCVLPALSLLLNLACNAAAISSPQDAPTRPLDQPSFALSSYFPTSEASGGWRKTTDPTKIATLGMNAEGLEALGAYTMSLPWERFRIAVSGYDPSNKASIVIKDGWIVGEYYNKASAKTGVYYLASNSKTFAMMVLGRVLLDYPSLGINLSSPFYDRRWLSTSFPKTRRL